MYVAPSRTRVWIDDQEVTDLATNTETPSNIFQEIFGIAVEDDSVERQAWFDEIMIATKRIGCHAFQAL